MLTSKKVVPYPIDRTALKMHFLSIRHNTGIKEIVPEPNGTKTILVDVKSQGFIYNPVGDELTIIREFPDKVQKTKPLIYSLNDRRIFCR